MSSASWRLTGKFENRPVEALDLAVLAFDPADQVVGGAASEVLDGLDAILAQRDHHGRSQAGNLVELVGNAELLALCVEFGLAGIEVVNGAVLDFGRRFLVETPEWSRFR